MRKRLYHLYKGKTQKSLKKEEKMKRYNNLPYIRLFSTVTIFLTKDKSEAFFIFVKFRFAVLNIYRDKQ